MADAQLCPWHRTDLRVTAVERRHAGFGCHRSHCSLQAGHDGVCEPGDD